MYVVAMYSSAHVIDVLSRYSRRQKKDAQAALWNAARNFGPDSITTSFVLEMVFKADAQTIAGAIGEGVNPRYGGLQADVKELESLTIDELKDKGVQATKGTIFRFDCSSQGVSVFMDGNKQGVAGFGGMGIAFVDLFMDDKTVSPALIDSCLDSWCGNSL